MLTGIASSFSLFVYQLRRFFIVINNEFSEFCWSFVGSYPCRRVGLFLKFFLVDIRLVEVVEFVAKTR